MSKLETRRFNNLVGNFSEIGWCKIKYPDPREWMYENDDELVQFRFELHSEFLKDHYEDRISNTDVTKCLARNFRSQLCKDGYIVLHDSVVDIYKVKRSHNIYMYIHSLSSVDKIVEITLIERHFIIETNKSKKNMEDIVKQSLGYLQNFNETLGFISKNQELEDTLSQEIEQRKKLENELNQLKLEMLEVKQKLDSVNEKNKSYENIIKTVRSFTFGEK